MQFDVPVCVREKVDHTLTWCSTKPKPLHLSAFMCVHIFFFFVLSTSFFFVLKLYSNGPSIFLSVSAGSHQSPFPRLTVLWFIAKRLCLLWNCAYFNLHLEFSLLSHSVPTIPLIFFLTVTVYHQNWSVRTLLAFFIYRTISSWTIPPSILWHLDPPPCFLQL